ncbi:MAG: (Fe-S)-binding protein [Deferrisomatales bacterium]
MALIETYDLDVFSPPCDPGAERYAAKARLSVDISDALPYLNATLRGAVYHKAASALTWTKGGRKVAFHPREIAISNLEDREQAAAEIRKIVDLVNRTWARRGEITPDESTRRAPSAIEVYKLLPGTNCKRCGEASCFAYAVKLAAGQQDLEHCPPLFEGPYAEQRRRLEALLL